VSFDLALFGVTVRYASGTVGLQPTTLELRPGEFTVLLGPSGAGKSTLLRCLNHLVVPSSGQVVVDGLGTLQRGALLREHRRNTGMVFQHHHLIGRLSALRNVLTGRLGYHTALRTLWPLPRRDREIALEALERVGLLHRALERSDRLSGGEQQRVGVARALAQRPRRILADEPVASLDPATARRVLSQLRHICREDGIAAVVSLHQVELALDHADRVIGLARGRVVLDAPPEGIRGNALEMLYGHDLPARQAPWTGPPELAAPDLIAAQENP
jgi:phosphonate transport system ATP-binding protein